ncbi:unnamed protein product [Didymodactylos carnosus]|uniref:Helix-turn-helix domain-containing protein n=1 Tax=Didymodactylos carnosus TaxID=1234261 RepID=A0A815M988_9BILA|nr:unnamed protein product [Didymodactylos carnosus]CAF1419333.1 unnamed protein product [Didymodactylos carnosus]CAF3995224.1 unnamed protein product [Didymodactylos carnosus]CAF4303427.1 unnamed protein product [Didymodactylos carnosus]
MFFPEYTDDLFMTTNQAIDEINQILEALQKKDINIQIKYTIDTSVNDLNVNIMNQNGQLITSIFHKPTTEPHILPYTSDHPRHIHRNIPYAALLRAARICSNVDNFNSEIVRIEMSLLLNHYPPNYLSKHFDRFLRLNNAINVFNTLDPHAYKDLHHKLLYQPTRNEKQRQGMLQDPVRSPAVLQTKIWDTSVMYPRYIFDSGFPKLFGKWWKKYYAFPGSPAETVKMRLVANTNDTLAKFFIHKKPPKELLIKMEELKEQ